MRMELQGKAASHELLFYNKIPPPPAPLTRQDSGLLHRRGFHLKTQDLLGPLEKREDETETPTTTEIEARVLPGGIGTYTITHVAAMASPERKMPEVYRGFQYHQQGSSTDHWPVPSGSRPLPSPISLPRKRPHMDSSQRSGKQFSDDDDDDVFSRREGSVSRVELTVKTPDGKGGEQKQPTTPRSKHSATEQRRRSKINDRFQILRELLPHNDQKRDKASFLLEVIEYIRFLQEKANKYEASQGWTQENAKLMPWKLSRDGIIDHTNAMKSGPSEPEYIYSGKFDDNNISVSPTMLSNAQNPSESEMSAGVSYKLVETPGFSTKDAAMPVSMEPAIYDNMTSQSQWFRSPCPAGSTVNSSTLNEHEELTIDEGTVRVSTAYSQELLTTLTQTMQNSGIDLSQASISVEINLGKRAIRRPAATTTIQNAKDQPDPSLSVLAMGHSSVGSSVEETKQALKKHKPENS